MDKKKSRYKGGSQSNKTSPFGGDTSEMTMKRHKSPNLICGPRIRYFDYTGLGKIYGHKNVPDVLASYLPTGKSHESRPTIFDEKKHLMSNKFESQSRSSPGRVNDNS